MTLQLLAFSEDHSMISKTKLDDRNLSQSIFAFDDLLIPTHVQQLLHVLFLFHTSKNVTYFWGKSQLYKENFALCFSSLFSFLFVFFRSILHRSYLVASNIVCVSLISIMSLALIPFQRRSLLSSTTLCAKSSFCYFSFSISKVS